MGKKLSHTVNGVCPTGLIPMRSATEMSLQHRWVLLVAEDSEGEQVGGERDLDGRSQVGAPPSSFPVT